MEPVARSIYCRHFKRRYDAMKRTSVISAKRQTPLVHLSIETQEVVQWKSKHLHTRPSYDLNWSMLRQSGPLTHCNIDHIEAVQHRTARSKMKDWSRPANQQPAITTGTTQTIVRGSLSSMLQYLGWDSLEERRGTMLYRIVHGLVTIPLHHSNLQWNTRHIRGHSTKFYVPTVQVDAYRFNFFPATVTLWNNLPPDVVLSPYVNCFRTSVSAIWLNIITHWVPQIHVLTCTFAYIVHQLVLSRYTHVLHLFFISDSQFQLQFPLMFLTSTGGFSSFCHADIISHARRCALLSYVHYWKRHREKEKGVP